MKVFIIVIAVTIALTGLWMGRSSLVRARQEAARAVGIETQARELEQKAADLGRLPQQPGQDLALAYAGIVNDMNMLARAHRVVCTVNVQQGKDGDVVAGATTSSFEGAREISVEIGFSGLKRRGALLSLMDAVSKAAAAWPVVLRRVFYEKDSLIISLAVVGL